MISIAYLQIEKRLQTNKIIIDTPQKVKAMFHVE